MAVYSYLDISTAHLTEAEMLAIRDNLPALEDVGPRVIVHEYGAWVNVPSDSLTMDETDEAAFTESYPNLRACLERARELGCLWVNFDQDAEQDPALATYEW